MKQLAIGVFVIVLMQLSGCNLMGVLPEQEQPSYAERMNPWKGKTVNELTLQFGAPGEVLPGTGGSQLYIYERYNTYYEVQCRTQFEVDQAGVIRDVQWVGHRCY